MLKALLLSLTAALAAMATAQNLVPNPSFEDTVNCSVWEPPQSKALHWYSPNTATPDLWDADLDRLCGKPMNPALSYYLEPFDGSRSSAGFQWYGPNSSNTREYLAANLLEELEAQRSYRVSLYCARRSINHAAIDRIGVYFGPDSLFQNDPNTLQVQPQVELMAPDGAYLESTQWIQLADTFVADGGENWVIFGTFNDANDVNGILVPPGWDNSAYYFFDQMEVVQLEGPNGLVESSRPSVIELQGNAFQWTGSVPLQGAMLLDATGRLVSNWSSMPAAAGQIFQLPALMTPGLYVITAWGIGFRHSTRFVKSEEGY